MTILSPQTSRISINLPLISIGVLLIVLTMWAIMMYNTNVQLTYEIGAAEERIDELRLGNADLYNALSELTTTQSLLRLAGEKGLLKVSAPSYLEISQAPWGIVSRY